MIPSLPYCRPLPATAAGLALLQCKRGQKTFCPLHLLLIGTMDLKLKPFDFAQAASRAGMADVAQRVQAKTRLEGMQGAQPAGKIEPSFQTSFSDALKGISKAQSTASAMQREVQFDNPTVSLEETMIAMQKSQLGFQSAVQFRNKLVQAYTDIMNMQV